MAKTKVLHVVSSMGYGGVQTWIVDLISESKNSTIHIDLLVYANEKWDLAEKSKSLGSSVFVCPDHHNIFTLFKMIRTINSTNGPYAAIHAHNMYQNGLVLACARIIGIPIRVSQSHNSTRNHKTDILRSLYNQAMRWLLPIVGTHLLAVSDKAGRTLYGRRWGKDDRHKTLYCGLDFSRFAPHLINQEATREEFGIPHTAKVIGHVGRFTFEKNHQFLLESVATAMKTDPDIYLMLVGDGNLRPSIELESQRLGIADRTIFTGTRSDIAKIMMTCFDMFILPSHNEGLGLVALEAMASGKQCLLSDSVPSDVDVAPNLITRLPLNAGAQKWAATLLEILRTPPGHSQSEAYALVTESDFSIAKSFTQLRQIYEA